MTRSEASIVVKVDVTNPGEFFACCGLLELADRLWPGVEGWFEGRTFRLESDHPLRELLNQIVEADLVHLEPGNETASPMRLGSPFDYKLDWWTTEFTGGNSLKVWAGSMRGVRIARAMQQAIANVSDPQRLFDFAAVVYDPDNPRKKVEPFYFDSRRGWNARSHDIGFAPDSLKMTSAAFPAVEFLCMVGLQRFRPAPTDQSRVFIYNRWDHPLPAIVAAVMATGAIRMRGTAAYRFQVAFRTDKKMHKCFLSATPLGVLT